MGISITKRPDKASSPTAKISRWLAVNGQYPVVFEFLRQDYKSIVYERTGIGKLAATIPLVDLTGEIQVGDFVYFHSVLYDKGTGEVKSVSLTSGGHTRITVDYLLEGTWTNDFDANNYINLLSSRSDYTVEIKVIDSITRAENSAEYRPFNDGRIEFDVSSFVGLPLSIDNDYSSVNKSQETISKKFYLEYTEKWSANEVTSTDVYNYYAVSGSMQLQETHAPNLLQYTAFGTTNVTEAEKGKFLTDFENPTYWIGFPFSLHYIVDNEDAFPTFKKVEEGFNSSSVSTGQAEITLSNPDYNYLNAINLTGSYPETDCELDVWIDSSLTPANTCAAISANDWKYPSFVFNGNFIQGIYMQTNAPASLIASIDSYPNGQLYQDGGLVDTLVYNGTLGYYEPSLGNDQIAFTGTLEARVLSVPVTTTAGESCTPDFSHIVYSDTSTAQPPTATSVVLAVQNSDPLYPGATLVGTYVFNDLDGDSEGATEEYIREYNSFADADNDLDATGGTQVTATASYATNTGDSGKYYVYWVKPVSTVAPTDGTITKSNVLGPVPNTLVSMSHNKQTGFTIDLTATSGQDYIINWDDGNIEGFTGSGGLQTQVHNYGSAGTYNPKIYSQSDILSVIDIASQDLLTLDISNTSFLTTVVANSNPGLTSVSMPATQVASITNLNLNTCDITGAFSCTNIPFTDASIQLQANANLTSWDLTGCTGTFTLLRGDNCNLTGTFTIPSGLNLNASLTNNQMYFMTNPNLTAFGMSNCTGKLQILHVYDCNITGILDLGSVEFTNIIVRADGNTQLTGWDISACTGDLNQWRFNGCGLSGTQVIDRPFDSVLTNNAIWTYSNSSNNYDLDLSGTSGNMNSLRFQQSRYVGTFTDPGFTWTGLGIFTCNNLSTNGLTSIDLSAGSGDLYFFDVGGNSNLVGALDLTGFNWVSICYFYCDSTGITSIDHTGTSTTGAGFDIYNCNSSALSGAHALGTFTFRADSALEIRSNSITSLDLSNCSGELRYLSIDNNNLSGTVDITGFNFDAVDAEIIVFNNASFTGFLFGASTTGQLESFQSYSTSIVLQVNDMGNLTISDTCNFEFFDCGLAASDVDNWWIQLDSMDDGAGASGSLEGGGTNGTPTATSAAERSNLTAAGYTVIT